MTKSLQLPLKSRTQSADFAAKIDKALQTYPFHDISQNLLLKINPRAKRLALRVDPHKRCINLVIPKYTSMRAAYRFALENKYWIRERVEELPQTIEYVDGAELSILGETVTIIITYDQALKTNSIELKNNELLVKTNKEDAAPRIRRFLIAMAREKLTTLAHEKAAQIEKEILKVDVKDTSSRWGSCSSDGRLSFSWRLIFAPDYAFDYVVAHEVAHLEHLDHSPAFWHVCEDLSDDYSRGKTWMKRHAQELIEYV